MVMPITVENDKNVKISEYSQYVTVLEKRLEVLVEKNKKLEKQLENHVRNQSLVERWAYGETE